MKIVRKARASLLSLMNQRQIRRGICNAGIGQQSLIAFVFTENLMHLAPYCLPETEGRFTPLLLLNGVTDNSARWLADLYPDHCIVRLQTSFRGNSQNMLAHGCVLDDLIAVIEQPFCIQDPDCFVTDSRFFDSVAVGDDDFAAGPFVKRPTDHDHVLPDTFFLMLNAPLFRSLARKHEFSAQTMRSVPKKSLEAFRRLGYQPGQFTENFKDYFDTLQAFWVVALSQGKRFRILEGADSTVFHVGGTSYLHKTDYELAHWDFWPLSVHYFNLRMLEEPVNARFRSSYCALFETYHSSDELLKRYPRFREGYRFQHMQRILETCVLRQGTLTRVS